MAKRPNNNKKSNLINPENFLQKLIIAALFSGISLVLSTLVVFPNMAPFQHMINVLAGVVLGPWWALAQAAITGCLRMMMGRSINALIGAVFGAWLAGMAYRLSHRVYLAVIGEIIGTGLIAAVVAYYVMTAGGDLADVSPFYYIPFFLPSSVVGSLLGGWLVAKLTNI